MNDFTDFNLKVEAIQKEHGGELHQPLSKYFSIFIKVDDSCALVWENDCPTLIRNKVIAAANDYLK
jgi:hypothetical protein